MKKLPESGVIIYTSRSGQQYPSYFDEKNDFYFVDSINYILDILANYVESPNYCTDVLDYKYIKTLNRYLAAHDQGNVSIIANEPSYEKYQKWL